MYLLALIGCLTFYLVYQQWFSWILLQIIVFFPWLSLLLSIGAMLRLRMDLDVAEKVSMGCPEQVTLKVSSKRLMPPYSSKIRVTKPLTGESWILKAGANLPTEHCGKLHIALHRPRVSDFLGIFRLKVRKAPEQTVLILPKPIGMKIPPDLSKHLAPRWRPKPGGGYAENHEIRQYHPGDKLNQIHWKLSAKTGKLTVREAMEPAKGRILLTMELQGSDAELDLKMGRFFWLSHSLLQKGMHHELHAATGEGMIRNKITSEETLLQTVDQLLGLPAVTSADAEAVPQWASWHYHIGGGIDET